MLNRNKNIFWVIGSPRSGTSFLTDYIGLKTDYCFNEPWKEYPLGKHKEWVLPKEGSIVFKYCANCFYYKEMSSLYKGSKWVHIIRKPEHVIYSMVFPKKDAKPERLWKYFGKGKERIIKSFNKWNKFIERCLEIKEAKIVYYEKINHEELSDFLGIKLDKSNFKNRNEIFEENKMQIIKDVLNKNKLNLKKILQKIY